MRRAFLIILYVLLFQTLGICSSVSSANTVIYSKDNHYGLQNNTEKITNPEFQKLIRLGEDSTFLFQKHNKYGIINNKGEILVNARYSNAERVFGKYAKLGNTSDWGLYTEDGTLVIPHEYSSIEPLFGKMFLTKKKYKYGIINQEGKQLLGNDFEDIYMPTPKTLRIKYNGEWFEIEKVSPEEISNFEDTQRFTIDDNEFTIKRIVNMTGAVSGYSFITTTDYALKLLSSISPAYEEAIDELMFSKGADTISILMKFSWLPKFPYTYAKNYYNTLKNPYNGPLSKIKSGMKKKL